MTAPALDLDARLSGEQRALRWRATSAVVLLAVAALLAVLAMLVLALGGGRWMAWPRAMPVFGWLSAIAGAGTLARWHFARQAQALSMASLAGTIEREQRLRAGSLRGALEVAGSGALGARAAQDVASRLARGTLAPAAGRQFTRQTLIGALLALVAALIVFLASRAAPDGLAAVQHPVRAWTGTLLPALAFERVPTSVPRGMPITLRIEATGRHSITVSRRAEEAWRDTTLQVPVSGIVPWPSVRYVHGRWFASMMDERRSCQHNSWSKIVAG